jgi:hypothetical protein
MNEKLKFRETIKFLQDAWENAGIEKTQYSRNERTYLNVLSNLTDNTAPEKLQNLINLVTISLRGMGILTEETSENIIKDIPELDLKNRKTNILLDWSAEFMPPALIALNKKYKDRVFLIISEKLQNKDSHIPKYGIVPRKENPFHFVSFKNVVQPQSILPVYFFPEEYKEAVFYDNSKTIDDVFSSKVLTAEILKKYGLPFPRYVSAENFQKEEIESFQGETIVVKVDYLNGGDGVFFISKEDILKAVLKQDIEKLLLHEKVDSGQIFFQEKINSPRIEVNGEKKHICFRTFVHKDPKTGKIFNNGSTVRINIENKPANFCHGGEGIRFEELCQKLNIPYKKLDSILFDLSKKTLNAFNDYFGNKKLEAKNLNENPLLFFNLDIMVDEELTPYILEVGHLSSGSMQMMTENERYQVFAPHFENISNYNFKKNLSSIDINL